MLNQLRKWLLVMCLCSLIIPVPIDGQELVPPTEGYQVQFSTPEASELPEDARDAIVHAMSAWPNNSPENNTFHLISLRWEKDWGLATVTSADLDAPLPEGANTHLEPKNLATLLLVRVSDEWQAAIDTDARVHTLLESVSLSELSESARDALFPSEEQISRTQVLGQQYGNYKLPWPAGPAWRMSNAIGWHNTGGYPAGYALDFDITGYSNSDILAAASGTVTWVCAGSKDQYFLAIQTDGTSEKFGYLHLDGATVRAEGIQLGTHVTQGKKLGRMRYADGGSVADECGTSYGTHIHLNFPAKPFTIDGVTFTTTDVHVGENLYSSQNLDTTPPTLVSNIQPDGWTGPYTRDTTPRFRWSAASDSDSGVAGYYVSPSDWTPEGSYGQDWWVGNVTAYTIPEALSDGEYHFAVTSKDKAGNVNPTNTNTRGDAPYYTFYVDTKAPTNPTTVSANCDAQNNVWQQTCRDPRFTWGGANDTNSGIKEYVVYWGTSSTGTPSQVTTAASFDPSAVASEEAGTYYLRVATRDRAGNLAAAKTLFTFRYDGSQPSADLAFDAFNLYDGQVSLSLQLPANDTGSGVQNMRFSPDGASWSAWQAYQSQPTWTHPAPSLEQISVLAQVQDGAGNVSQVNGLDLIPQDGPGISVPDGTTAYPQDIVSVPISFIGRGHAIATTDFSLDLPETCLSFDPHDTDQDGIPDAISFSLPPAFQPTVDFDATDTNGEIDIVIADTVAPLASLPDSVIATVELNVNCRPTPGTTLTATLAFANAPWASFLTTNEEQVLGTTTGTTVRILSGTPGDCNRDDRVDAGDISALVLEIFDGDGSDPQQTPTGSFAGDPVGCDANEDGLIDAGDLSCTPLLIFNGPGVCANLSQ